MQVHQVDQGEGGQIEVWLLLQEAQETIDTRVRWFNGGFISRYTQLKQSYITSKQSINQILFIARFSLPMKIFP